MTPDRVVEILKNYIKKNIPLTITIGKVKEVRGEVLDVEREGLPDLLDVVINVIERDLQSFCRVIPKVGSYVICGVVENGEEAILLQTSELEKIEVKFNNDNILIDKEGINITSENITINNGENGGLTITPKLVEELKKNNEILEGILNVINGTPIMEAGNGSPSAFQISLKGAVTGKVVGNFSEIENNKIKH